MEITKIVKPFIKRGCQYFCQYSVPTSQLQYVHVYPVKQQFRICSVLSQDSHTCGVVVIMAECHVRVIKPAIVKFSVLGCTALSRECVCLLRVMGS